MTAHVCGTFDQPKRAGSCLCCGEAAYQILAVHPDGHPLAGHPSRVGPMLPDSVQVSFLMSDGSESDITFCLDCARALTPAHYPRVWDRVIDATDRMVTLANRRPVERRLLLRPQMAIYPIAILHWRRESRELNRLVMDRRRREAVHG